MSGGAKTGYNKRRADFFWDLLFDPSPARRADDVFPSPARRVLIFLNGWMGLRVMTAQTAQASKPFCDVRKITDEYFPRIHRAALVLTGNPWDADDLAQETFLVMAKSIARFQGRSSLYTWLYGILLNLERRERRRNGLRKRKLRVLWDNDTHRDQSVPAAETSIEVGEWKRSLWAVVSELPDGQRLALVLRYSEHLSYEEVARLLECPLGTVKSRIFHGLAALRRMLDNDDGQLKEMPKHAREDMIDVV